jgi:hypothetical protein
MYCASHGSTSSKGLPGTGFTRNPTLGKGIIIDQDPFVKAKREQNYRTVWTELEKSPRAESSTSSSNKPKPLNFQHIISTTSHPPEEYQSLPYLRLQLNSASSQGRLFKQDL